MDGVKRLVGVPGKVASKLGASVLQDALAWLLGGLKATITLALVKFLVHVELSAGGSLGRLTGPMIVIGGFFLVVGLITSVGDGYREIIAGADSAPRVIGQAIFRVIGLAILLGSWFWLVPLAVDVANGMSGYVLADGAVGSALRRTFGGEQLLAGGFPLLGLLTGIMLAFAILALVVLKFIIAIAFAGLYVGGPALIGFAALPRVGNAPLAIAVRGLFTLTVIPLLWTIVFAAWAGVSAGVFESATGGGGVIRGLMGPGLFLAGLVVMLGVTKKALAMATYGVPLSMPGGRLARSAAMMAVARGMGGAAKGAAAGGAAKQGEGEQPPGKTRHPGDHGHQVARGAGHSGQPTNAPGRSFRKLEIDDPASATHKRDHALTRRAAGASISLLGASRQGVFEQPHRVSDEAWASVSEQVAERHARGEPSLEQVRDVAHDLPDIDRSGFGVLAKESLAQRPESARGLYENTATRVIASRAQQLTPEQLRAGITLSAARPEVVNEALAPDYRAWGHGHEEPDTRGPYDPKLMDQRGGLEQAREGPVSERPEVPDGRGGEGELPF
ncbi:MAG: hypothetical protein ACR2GL_00830 [Thermoleophilaceae bacterium]